MTGRMRSMLAALCFICFHVPLWGADRPAAAAPGAGPVVGLVYTSTQAAAWPGTDILELYTRAITENGGSVVLLAQTLAPEENERRLAAIDALLLPGGDDVSPDLYGEAPAPQLETVDREFDLYEFAAVKAARARGIPILGICKGHQLLAVYFGGSLYQDLPAQLGKKVVHRVRKDGASSPCYHEVRFKKGGTLEGLFGKKRYRVNSYHHQGVRSVGGPLRATAWSKDGLIEAMEGENVIAVQFHPEKERDKEPVFDSIFRRFLSMAGKK